MSVEHDAIAQMVDGFEKGSVVTKYVAIAEVITPDGSRVKWHAVSEDTPRWDLKGLLVDTLDEMCGDDDG